MRLWRVEQDRHRGAWSSALPGPSAVLAVACARSVFGSPCWPRSCRQRSSTAPWRRCVSFTFRQTRRIVPIVFSMMLVQASDRRNRRQAEAVDGEDVVDPLKVAAGAAGGDLFEATREVAQQFSAFPASLSFHAWRSVLRTGVWSDSAAARRCCGPCGPGSAGPACCGHKARRIALPSAFAPSMKSSRFATGCHAALNCETQF